MVKMRIGITGAGFIGCQHGKNIIDGKVPNAELVAIVARSERSKKNVKEQLGDKIKIFSSDEEMYRSKLIDGVIIATPHYSHPEQGLAAFKHDLHILMEKPVGVFTSNVRELNAVAKKSNKQFALMFNMRAKPLFKKIKSLLEEKAIGEIQRIHWNITDMYRSQAYYDSNEWRATWSGEGGGVLINQASHYLDLFQWYFGMPKNLRADCYFGKYRKIEVEDDVTAYLNFANGANAIFHVTTGEVCGGNRLEIVGNSGKIIMEGSSIAVFKSNMSGSDFNKTNKEVWASPSFTQETTTYEDNPLSHANVISNWVQACLDGESIIAPGLDGVQSLLLSNAMYLSAWQNKVIDFPFDENDFSRMLNEKIKTSKPRINN